MGHNNIIFQIYTIYMKTEEKLWAINTALSIYLKIQIYANIILWLKDEHFCLRKSWILELLEN